MRCDRRSTCSGRFLPTEISNLGEVKHEIIKLGRSPLSERVYPIPSDWVPLTDVLAILTRFTKHWTEFRPQTEGKEAKLISEIFGETWGEHVSRFTFYFRFKIVGERMTIIILSLLGRKFQFDSVLMFETPTVKWLKWRLVHKLLTTKAPSGFPIARIVRTHCWITVPLPTGTAQRIDAAVEDFNSHYTVSSEIEDREGTESRNTSVTNASGVWAHDDPILGVLQVHLGVAHMILNCSGRCLLTVITTSFIDRMEVYSNRRFQM